MIPRSLGLSAKVEPRTVVAAFVGLLVWIVMGAIIPFRFLDDSAAWRVAHAAGFAGAWLVAGVLIGSLPRALAHVVVTSICFVSIVMYLLTLPFHEVDAYVSTIQVMLIVSCVILGARLRAWGRARLTPPA